MRLRIAREEDLRPARITRADEARAPGSALLVYLDDERARAKSTRGGILYGRCRLSLAVGRSRVEISLM
jgi:hypothetical protein